MRAILLALNDDSRGGRLRIDNKISNGAGRPGGGGARHGEISRENIHVFHFELRGNIVATTSPAPGVGPPRSEWKFDARRLNSHSRSMYRVCTACRIPPCSEPSVLANTRAPTHPPTHTHTHAIQRIVDTPLCRHVHFCRYLNGGRRTTNP